MNYGIPDNLRKSTFNSILSVVIFPPASGWQCNVAHRIVARQSRYIYGYISLIKCSSSLGNCSRKNVSMPPCGLAEAASDCTGVSGRTDASSSRATVTGVAGNSRADSFPCCQEKLSDHAGLTRSTKRICKAGTTWPHCPSF